MATPVVRRRKNDPTTVRAAATQKRSDDGPRGGGAVENGAGAHGAGRGDAAAAARIPRRRPGRYDAAAEARVLDELADAFLAKGATAVETHLYDLYRRPPQMPSARAVPDAPGRVHLDAMFTPPMFSKMPFDVLVPTRRPSKSSGANPGKSANQRFELVWPSYALHLLVHSVVWRDVERYERRHVKFDFVVKMRADANWLEDAPAAAVPKLRGAFKMQVLCARRACS